MDRIIIDVREPFEYASGHVNGAINIPLSKIMNDTKKLDGIASNSEIILYCNSGNRSGVATHILKTNGFTGIVNGINKSHVESLYAETLKS